MRRQIFINSWSPVVAVDEDKKQAKIPRILIVENGTGFGGAVVALRTLLTEGLPMPITFGVVSGGDYGFGNIPGVSMTAVASSHSPRFYDVAARISNRLHWIPAAWKSFVLGRIDDLCVRLPYFLRLVSLGLSFKPDLVHGNNELISNREALLLAKLLGVPYVQHMRGPSSKSAKLQYLIGLPDLYIAVSRWLYFESLERGMPTNRLLQLYDGVANTNQQTGAKAVARVTEERFGSKRGAPVVAMVGMLVPWKGQALFIEAVAQIHKDHPETTFLIVGATPDRQNERYEEELRAKVLELGLASIVQFTGQITELSTRMHDLDIVVSASLEPEPLGLVMIEALRSGCYFIGPDHGATAEFIAGSDYGRLFVPGDVKSLATAISISLSDEGRFNPASRDLRMREMSEVSPATCAASVAASYSALLG